MIYQVFSPTPELVPYVRFFWALEGAVPSGEEFVHRSMADGCVEIVFTYSGAFDEIGHEGERAASSSAASIQAQSASFRRYVTRESFGMFGAYLYPFSLPKLFLLPASDFSDLAVDIDQVVGAAGRVLDQRVAECESNEERARVVSDFLLKRLRTSSGALPRAHLAVRSMLDANGAVRIADIAREHSLSIRQFERKFKELAGFSPKLYSRIIRFQAATQQRLSGSRDLTEIAYSCGYYDQSHFINDFREFSGYTPKEYFWHTAEGTQYMDA